LFKFEKITKIGTGFIQHSFGLRFTAVVISANFVKRTVKAAMQISAAGRALRLPSDKNILRNFFFTFVADVHESENTSYACYLSRSFRNHVRGI